MLSWFIHSPPRNYLFCLSVSVVEVNGMQWKGSVFPLTVSIISWRALHNPFLRPISSQFIFWQWYQEVNLAPPLSHSVPVLTREELAVDIYYTIYSIWSLSFTSKNFLLWNYLISTFICASVNINFSILVYLML